MTGRGVRELWHLACVWKEPHSRTYLVMSVLMLGKVAIVSKFQNKRMSRHGNNTCHIGVLVISLSVCINKPSRYK